MEEEIYFVVSVVFGLLAVRCGSVSGSVRFGSGSALCDIVLFSGGSILFGGYDSDSMTY